MIYKRLFVLFAILGCVACSQKEKAVIVGRIKNIDSDQTCYLQEVRVSSSRIIDSTQIKFNGRFRYRLNLKSPGLYQLNLSDEYRILLIVSPGEKVVIKGDFDNFYGSKEILGSSNSERVNILHDSLRSTIAQLNEIRDFYTELADTMTDLSSRKDQLNQQFAEVKQVHHNYSVRYILEDLSSLTNIPALFQEYAPNEYVFNQTRDLQYFKLVTDTLSKYYPKMRHVKALQEYYSQLMSEYNKQRILQSKEAVHSDVPDLKLPSPAGKSISLSSLKGKLVLLSFWSPDQPESLQNTIDLKKIYSKYRKAGFEIYQVAVTESFQKFRKSVAFEELNWVCVVDTTFPNSQTRYLYNVNNLPMNYLINKEHTEILAKNLSPEVLEQTIQYLSVKPD